MRRSFRRSRQASILVLVTLLVGVLATPLPAIAENLTKSATNNHVFEAGMWGAIEDLNGWRAVGSNTATRRAGGIGDAGVCRIDQHASTLLFPRPEGAHKETV